MTNFSITVDIQAPPERVWAVMSDVERWPEWTPTVTSMKLRDPGPLAPGSRVLICQPKFPPAEWRLTELDEGRSFTWVNRGPGVLVTARHGVVPGSSTGGDRDKSQATLSLEFAGILGPLVARLTRNLNERYLALEAKGLKQRSESDLAATEAGRETVQAR